MIRVTKVNEEIRRRLRRSIFPEKEAYILPERKPIMDPRCRALIEANLNELVRVTNWNPKLEDIVAKNIKLRKVLEAVQVEL